jgi:mRNA interferase RelE/StbE
LKSYELDFLEDALKEWKKLDSSIRNQFARKLAERLKHPHIPSARLWGMPGCYKVKLRSSGYRLVYQVEDEVLVVLVIAVGKRERSEIYRQAARRIKR